LSRNLTFQRSRSSTTTRSFTRTPMARWIPRKVTLSPSNPGTQYQSMTRDDIKVSVYGHTAVVTCHWEVHVVAQGNKIDTNARYLHVYVEQPNGWKLVA